MNKLTNWLLQTLVVLFLVFLLGAPYLHSRLIDMEYSQQAAIADTMKIAQGMTVRMNQQDEQIKQLRKAIENNYEMTQAVLKAVLSNQEKNK